MMTAEEIRSLRQAFDYTQEEFARVVGISMRQVSMWETGRAVPLKRHTRKMAKLSDKLALLSQKGE
jgi:DNA-binding transcriptional regulator YiaG